MGKGDEGSTNIYGSSDTENLNGYENLNEKEYEYQLIKGDP